MTASQGRPPIASSTKYRGRLPPLIALRALEATGRTGSMRRAADDIGVSHTVVSRHIRNLEAWLGQKLLIAGPRGITLTVDGVLLVESVHDAFDSIANAVSQIRSRHPLSTLSIWCMPGLAARWLTPRLSEVEALLPNIDISIRATVDHPNFAQGEADLMIAFGEFEDIPPNSIPLLEPEMFPVASPQWLSENGTPENLSQLADAPLIHEESYEQWTRWLRAVGFAAPAKLRGSRLGSADLGLDAALAHQGIALTTDLMAADEIESGRLTRVSEFRPTLGGYYLSLAPQRQADPSATALASWLRQNLSSGSASGTRAAPH